MKFNFDPPSPFPAPIADSLAILDSSLATTKEAASTTRQLRSTLRKFTRLYRFSLKAIRFYPDMETSLIFITGRHRFFSFLQARLTKLFSHIQDLQYCIIINTISSDYFVEPDFFTFTTNSIFPTFKRADAHSILENSITTDTSKILHDLPDDYNSLSDLEE